MERCFAADATISTSLMAVVPEAGWGDPQNSSIWRCLGANLRLCARGCLPRLCLRCGPDGAQSRAGARPAWACPGAFRLAGIEIRKQTEFLVLEKLRPALEAAGSSLEQSLKAQMYLANIEDSPDCP